MLLITKNLPGPISKDKQLPTVFYFEGFGSLALEQKVDKVSLRIDTIWVNDFPLFYWQGIQELGYFNINSRMKDEVLRKLRLLVVNLYSIGICFPVEFLTDLGWEISI